MTIEDRLRGALNETAAEVGPSPERWDDVERRASAARVGERRRRNRWRNGGLAVVGVAAGVAALSALPGLGHDSTQVRIHPAGGPGPGVTAAPTSTVSPPTSQAGQTGPTTPPTSKPVTAFSYQPLWPFRSLAEADNWQASYRASGAQPWHLDPSQTALNFSHGYLGYQDINASFSNRTDATGAHVAVGFADPNGHPVKAAVIHLRQFGAGPNAPWEVVGTDDTDFTLSSPTYGALVGSPVIVAGTITGVDENIKVQILQLSSASPLGQSPGLPAGGTATPWTTSAPFKGATDGVVTIAASTGGHLAAVERFTITAARSSAASPAGP